MSNLVTPVIFPEPTVFSYNLLIEQIEKLFNTSSISPMHPIPTYQPSLSSGISSYFLWPNNTPTTTTANGDDDVADDDDIHYNSPLLGFVVVTGGGTTHHKSNKKNTITNKYCSW